MLYEVNGLFFNKKECVYIIVFPSTEKKSIIKMENIIEAAGRKEVARQQQQQEVVNKAPKKKVFEKRMSHLLTRIRNNTSLSCSSASATPFEKSEKVNVKWKRFSPLTGQKAEDTALLT